MNISQFELLTLIAQTGSFTEAAQRLGLTQSAASRAVSRLEEELGVVLFERGRGRIQLTSMGEKIMPHISAIRNELELIRQETMATRGISAGRLRLGIYKTLSSRLLTGMLSAFRSRYPGIEIATLAGTAADVTQWIKNRTVDVGFLHDRNVDIDKVLVAEDEVMVVLPQQLAQRLGSRITLQRLQNEPLIASRADCNEVIDAIFAEAGAAYHRQFDVEDTDTLLAMIREGFGYGLVPTLNLPDERTSLHIVRLQPPVRRQLFLGVWRFADSPNSVRAFVEEASAWARRKGYVLPLEASQTTTVEMQSLPKGIVERQNGS